MYFTAKYMYVLTAKYIPIAWNNPLKQSPMGVRENKF